MKKSIITLFILLFFTQSVLLAQTITTPKDSIERYICRSWEVDYAMLGGMKIGRMPGAEEINYEFKKDKTFVSTNDKGKTILKGTWIYDARKRIINLKDDRGVSKNTIVSLNAGELIILVDTKAATPDDPMEMKLVYKIKGQ